MDDPKDVAKWEKTKYVNDFDKGMRQFMGIQTRAKTPEYDRGWEFAFNWPDWAKKVVNELQMQGMSFEDAFDHVKAGNIKAPDGTR